MTFCHNLFPTVDVTIYIGIYGQQSKMELKYKIMYGATKFLNQACKKILIHAYKRSSQIYGEKMCLLEKICTKINVF